MNASVIGSSFEQDRRFQQRKPILSQGLKTDERVLKHRDQETHHLSDTTGR
jgi:hypothetical protein